MRTPVRVLCLLASMLTGSLVLADDAVPRSPAPPPGVEPALLVLSAGGVTYSSEEGVLSLLDVGATTIVDAEKPDRAIGHMPTRDAVRVWRDGPGAFSSEPPFATLSTFLPDGSVNEVVLELNHPQLEGDTLSFEARVVRGCPPETGGASTLFIAATDLPLFRLANPGVPLHTAPGAVFYGR